MKTPIGLRAAVQNPVQEVDSSARLDVMRRGTPARVSFSRNSQIVRNAVRQAKPQKPHERQAFVDQELCAFFRQIVGRLDHQDLEHQHRIERRTAALRAVRMAKRRRQIGAENLEIHRAGKREQLVAKVARAPQALIDVKQSRQTGHRLIPRPSATSASTIVRFGQVFSTVKLLLVTLELRPVDVTFVMILQKNLALGEGAIMPARLAGSTIEVIVQSLRASGVNALVSLRQKASIPSASGSATFESCSVKR